MNDLLRAIPLSDKAVLSTSILIDWDGVKFLFDAGPGITNEIYDRKLGLGQIELVLISHSHIDHFWDLVPLLWLKRMLGHRRRVQVVCPKDQLQLFEWCVKVSQAGEITSVMGMEPDQKIEVAGLNVEAFQVNHAKDQSCLGYAVSEKIRRKLKTEKLEEKGVPIELWRKIARDETVDYKGETLLPRDYSYTEQRKVIYSGDTGSCDRLLKAARGGTLLIVESTFLDEGYRDMANEYGHMIVKDAVKLAIDAKVKNVLLTHRSLRHSVEESLAEARKAAANVSEPPKLFIGTDPVIVN